MPLYSVTRTDAAQPGEFTDALVIAGGTSQARNAVAHLLPKGAKVSAKRLDVSGPRGGGKIQLLVSNFDEREPLTQPDELGTDSVYTLPAHTVDESA